MTEQLPPQDPPRSSHFAQPIVANVPDPKCRRCGRPVKKLTLAQEWVHVRVMP
jgi:hypothetical protein